MTTTIKNIPIAEIKRAACAFDGCLNTTNVGALDACWTSLLMFADKTPRINILEVQNWVRDTVLCPEHSKTINGLLKPLHSHLGKKVGGSR
jgi:hypothetical protein